MRNFSVGALFVFCLFCVTFALRPAMACGVCITFPEETAGDRILSAEIIVVATPGQQNPFTFEPHKIIFGDPSKLDETPPIPFLVDRSVRAAQSIGGTGAVVMSFGAANTKPSFNRPQKSWHRLFSVNTARLAFVDALLNQGEPWVPGSTDEADKVAFFAEYLTHEDSFLRDTALIELDRAPYKLLREITNVPPTAFLLQSLETINRAVFAPVAIKLLAADGRTSTEDLLRAAYPTKLATNGLRLHAWTIAALEVDGKEAMPLIHKRLSSKLTADEARLQMIAALADVGDADPGLRPFIADIYAVSLHHSLIGTSDIAFTMNSWGDGSLNPQFETLLRDSNLDQLTQFVLRAVVDSDG